MSEFSRYSRQVILREVGVNGQALLRDSSVMVIGLGGLGSAALPYLAGAGVGRLLIADRDAVDLSNLQRQVLYRQADVGQLKTDAARAQIRALNPEVEVTCLTAENWPQALAQADVVLDCTDNFPARFAINAACVRARKPLVSGAAIRLEGQVALFAPRGGCYACLYPEAGDIQETCEEAGILGPVVGVIGALQAHLALKKLLGTGDDAGRLHLWDAQSMHWRSLTIRPDPHCLVCATP